MKAQNTIAVALTIALTFAASAVYFWQADELVDTQSLTSSPSNSEQTRYGSTATRLGDTGFRELPDSETMTSTIVTATGLDIALCRFGSERVLNTETGTHEWRCMRSAYWDFTTATLEGLVYSDPEAARVLAHRIKDTNYSRALLLASRSTALSGGDVTPLLQARRWRPTHQQNGDPDLSGMGQAYVLSELADQIQSNSRSRSARYATTIMQNSADPDAAMQYLNEVVERMLFEIQQIEIDVTGQSTIGGDDDA